MYIREDKHALADGTVRAYVSLAHNIWEAGPMGKKRTKPVIFARLGVADDLDIEMVRSARDAFDRYLQKRLRRAGLPEEPLPVDRAADIGKVAEEVRANQPQLRILTSRAFGLRALLEPVWASMGFERVMRDVAAAHRLRFDFERVVFGMVLNRLVDPKSKRACNEWLKEEAYFPEADEWDVHHFYRALDVLEAHSQEISDAVTAAVRDKMPDGEWTLLLADTTAAYFESDFDDLERAAILEAWKAYGRGEGPAPGMPSPQVVNDPPLRMRGHSKDRRPDKPQVVVGLVTGSRGRVLTHRVFAGNSSDQTLAMETFNEALRNMPDDAKPVLVADSGMSGGPNLSAIDRAGLHRISTVPKRRSKWVRRLLSRPGRWRRHPTKPDLKYRVMYLDEAESPSGRAERWIATRNDKEAARQERKLEKDLARIRAQLAEDDRLDAHGRPMCELLTRAPLRRLVRKSSDKRRIELDTEAVAYERKLAGLKVLRTTLLEHDAVAIMAAYQELVHVENDFRTFKGPLRLRPMYHRRAHRIRAHVLVCVLSLVMLQELERRSGWRFREIVAAVGPVRANRLRQGCSEFWMRSEWPKRAKALLEALGQPVGPQTWGATRLEAEGRPSGSKESRPPDI